MIEWQISQVGVTASIKWSSRLKNGQVTSRCASTYYEFQFFNIEYHADIQIVECESGGIAQKWSSASRLCESVMRILMRVLDHSLILIIQSTTLSKIVYLVYIAATVSGITNYSLFIIFCIKIEYDSMLSLHWQTNFCGFGFFILLTICLICLFLHASLKFSRVLVLD